MAFLKDDVYQNLYIDEMHKVIDINEFLSHVSSSDTEHNNLIPNFIAMPLPRKIPDDDVEEENYYRITDNWFEQTNIGYMDFFLNKLLEILEDPMIMISIYNKISDYVQNKYEIQLTSIHECLTKEQIINIVRKYYTNLLQTKWLASDDIFMLLSKKKIIMSDTIADDIIRYLIENKN
jgi:hypothetical protein